MARANLNKSENFVTNTIAASKYIPNVLGSSSIWTRISYRNGWNTEALIFENLKTVEIIKKSFEHHLNILKYI